MNELVIHDFLREVGLNEYGAAGLMGNLFAESGLNPKNLQNTYEKSLGFTDDSYTAAVDNGTYTNFVYDRAGYGLWQLTYWSRKEGFLKYAKSKGKSIGDLRTQLEYLVIELRQYGLLDALKNASSVQEASDLILLNFEKPQSINEPDTRAKAMETRASYGQRYYDQFAAQECDMTIEEFTNLFQSMRQGLQDNDAGEWSVAARQWAIGCGLIRGNGTQVNGQPNYMWQDFLTREQLVTTLYRFAEVTGAI